MAGTILSVLTIVSIVFFTPIISSENPERYLETKAKADIKMNLVIYSLIAFLICTFLFLVNLAAGLINRMYRKK